MTQRRDVPAYVKQFGTACGGNWTAMLLTALHAGDPDIYAQIPDGQSLPYFYVYELIATGQYMTVEQWREQHGGNLELVGA